jgi:hypothetical protein
MDGMNKTNIPWGDILTKILEAIPLLNTYLEIQQEKLPMKEEFIKEKFGLKKDRKARKRIKVQFRTRRLQDKIERKDGFKNETGPQG